MALKVGLVTGNRRPVKKSLLELCAPSAFEVSKLPLLK